MQVWLHKIGVRLLGKLIICIESAGPLWGHCIGLLIHVQLSMKITKRKSPRVCDVKALSLTNGNRNSIKAPSFKFDTLNNDIVKKSYYTFLNQIFLCKFSFLLLTLKQKLNRGVQMRKKMRYSIGFICQYSPIKKNTTPSSDACRIHPIDHTGRF